MKKRNIIILVIAILLTALSLIILMNKLNQNEKGKETNQMKDADQMKDTHQPDQKDQAEQNDPLDQTNEVVTAVINTTPNTICNPINISYQYQEGYYSRESADPAVIMYQDEYYLFASHGSGYWWSTDLTKWNYIYTSPQDMPEIDKFAPAVCVIGDTMYLTHSGSGSIYKTNDPKSGNWEYVSHPVSWDDPALFVDDDGGVYCYYGCSNATPLYVVKLDPNNNMALLEGPIELLNSNNAAHGFEVAGDYNTDYNGDCWLEGAWMTKHDNTYYLQYAVPGTQYAGYSDGCYFSSSPMGPFTFCENSPISYKATGFMRGAGHGSILKDSKDNLWKYSTVSISVNHMFERRLVMVPAKFDSQDQLVTNMVFADYPMYIPNNGLGSFDQPGPDWNLVSYGKTASASTTLEGHDAKLAFDENMRTWWSAKTGDKGEWLTVDLGKPCIVNSLQLNFADQNILNVKGRDNTYSYRYLIEYSLDGTEWLTFADKSNVTGEANKALDTSHDYYELVDGVEIQYVRITNMGEIPAGGTFAISGLRLFGNGQGEAPAPVSDFTVTRSASEERTATLTWAAAENAEGYMIRYGNKEDSLNIHYQVIGETSATINNLNMGVNYYFTVDSYNDSGTTKGDTIKNAAATQPVPTPKVALAPTLSVAEVIEGFEVYEVENSVLGNGASKSSAQEDQGASGGATVHNLHNADSYFEVINVDGGNGGEGTLYLCYSNGNASSKTEVLVNGKSIDTFTLTSTGGWASFKTIELPINNLTAGKTNTIRCVGGQEGFNPDFIQVIYK